MIRFVKQIALAVALCFLVACQGGNHKEDGTAVSTEGLKTIAVQVEDGIFERLGDYLRADTYVCLDTVPLLGDLEKVEIKDDRIYVLDAFDKIVCYNMQGKTLFVLDAKGGGPGEYASVTDFAVNMERQELLVYDRDKKTLLFYHPHTGQFLRSEPFAKPTPGALAAWQGTYFYDNKSHDNYPDDLSLHYSLLTSRDGVELTNRYFPHMEAESAYRFTVTAHPFSYNDSVLYYCKNYDHLVYALSADSVWGAFDIRLPNPLPASLIESKADERDLVKSAYSIGIEQVFVCNGLLYFTFTKDGFLQSALYDLVRGQQIYCGRRMSDKKGKSVPLFRLIDGVYRQHFWGILSPDALAYEQEHRSEDIPDILQEYNPETGNHVIAFYAVKPDRVEE